MDFLTGLAFQAGISLNTPTGDSDVVDFREPYGIHLKVHKEDFPVYVWTSYSQQENFVLGQGIADIDSFDFGFGTRTDVATNVALFLEAGYSVNDQNNSVEAQQEVVYTYLVDRHNVATRPIPVNVPGDYVTDTYSTVYDLEPGFVAKIGAEFQVTDNFSVNAAYRFERMEARFELYDGNNRTNGLGWWQERQTLDAGAFEVQFLFNF